MSAVTPLGSGRRRRQQSTPPDVCVLSTDWRATTGLVAEVAAAGLATGPVVAWGQRIGYLYLIRCHPALLLVDLPQTVDAVGLVRYVRAAMLLAPVVVTAPPGADVVAGLDAGAMGVLDRRAPAVELAARLRAMHRALAPAAGGPTGPDCQDRELRPGQRLLLDLFRRGRPICCHQLRWLLGRPGRPLGIAAVKSRVARLEPVLRARGMVLSGHRGWGVCSYRAVPAGEAGHAGLAVCTAR